MFHKTELYHYANSAVNNPLKYISVHPTYEGLRLS